MEPTLILVPMLLILMIGFYLFTFAMFLKKAQPGTAFVRAGFGGSKVSRDSIMVFPMLHFLSVVDLKSKAFTTHFLNLLTKDDKRMQLKIQFKVSVSATSQDILMVAQTFGAPNTFDVEALRSYFEPQFIEAIKMASPQFTFEEIEKNLAKFKEQIIMIIGTDLNGYYLDDCSIYEISEV